MTKKEEGNPVASYLPGKKDRESLSFAREVRDYTLWSKRPYEEVWYIISAFLLGRQYGEEDILLSGSFRDFKAPSWRVRMVSNRMYPMYLREMARLTQGPALHDVIPASDLPKDKNRAAISEKLLLYFSQTGRLDLEKKHEEFCSWLLRTGTAFYKVVWDSLAGDLITEYETEPVWEKRPSMDAYGNPVIDPITGLPAIEDIQTGEQKVVYDENGDPVIKEQFRIGDVVVKVISPFDISLHDRYNNIQEAPWICHNYVARVADLAEKYPAAKKIDPPAEITTYKFYPERLRQIVSSMTARSWGSPLSQDIARKSKFKDSSMAKNKEGLAVVYEIWQKANEEYPHGRLLIVCEDVILYDGINPYDDCKYPFVAAKENEWYGRFWGVPTLEHVIPMQKSYNRSRSQEIEDANLTANPILINYTAGSVNKDQLINRPGAIVDVPMPGLEPKYLERNRIDAVIYGNIQQKAVADMQEVSSQHDVSRGKRPTGVDSGLAMAFLNQRDQAMTMPKVRRLNQAREELARMILSRVAQFYIEDRIIKIGGPGTDVESFYFKGKDIVGKDSGKDYFDVRIRPSSTAPVNRAAMKSEVLTYIQAGILNPMDPNDKRHIATMLEIGSSKEFMEEARLDHIRAKKEIELLKNKEQVDVRMYENHSIHIEEFVKFMKTDEFYNLDIQVQSAFLQHIEEHQQYIMQSMQAMVPPGGGENVKGLNESGSQSPPTIGRKSQEANSVMTDQGGAQRNQKVSTLRGIYGGESYG